MEEKADDVGLINLPPEIVIQILGYLQAFADIRALSLTCSRLHELISASSTLDLLTNRGLKKFHQPCLHDVERDLQASLLISKWILHDVGETFGFWQSEEDYGRLRFVQYCPTSLPSVHQPSSQPEIANRMEGAICLSNFERCPGDLICQFTETLRGVSRDASCFDTVISYPDLSLNPVPESVRLKVRSVLSDDFPLDVTIDDRDESFDLFYSFLTKFECSRPPNIYTRSLLENNECLISMDSSQWDFWGRRLGSIPSLAATPGIFNPPLEPGWFGASYSAHGLELIDLRYVTSNNQQLLIGTKLIGDPNVPSMKHSFVIDLHRPVRLNTRQESKDVKRLFELFDEPFPPSSSPQPFDLPADFTAQYFQGDSIDPSHSKCQSRYLGEGLIAMEDFTHPRWTRTHFICFDNDHFGILFLDLHNFMMFKRYADSKTHPLQIYQNLTQKFCTASVASDNVY